MLIFLKNLKTISETAREMKMDYYLMKLTVKRIKMVSVAVQRINVLLLINWNYLKKLMMKYLHINKEKVEEQSVEEFMAENLDLDVTDIEDNFDFYNESLDALLEETVRVDSKLRNEENRISLLTMMAYSYNVDRDLDDWLREYAKHNNTYFVDQRKNFLHMKDHFEKWEKENKKTA